ncbi:MFS transporter [Spiractinospora alimapuensis]|uniref:MFS transporter n=1 Tax=Spiractinospora alimapuensis TaxID=2820884 RepID=UPI001F2E3A0A|nr:MFS transporter [Spiractinospora alimapuensis]QVQ50764.1 MFS transporter [Spiractinospora alimapuensis]
MRTTSTPERAGTREWLGLAVLALPTLLVGINTTVLFLAQPELSSELGANEAQRLWITDIYGFLIAGFLITMGTLGDRIGRRRLLLLGAAAFSLASVLAAFSPTPEIAIATRGLMGVAGATIMPSTLSLLRSMFQDPRQRTSAIAVWATSLSVGIALGPLLSGAMLQFFWWGSTLLVGVPFLLLLLVAGPFLLPEYRDTTVRASIDLLSVLLSLAAVLSIIYGIKRAATEGLAPTPLIAAGAGLAIGYWFLRRQRTLAAPLLDLRMFRNAAFSTALLLIVLVLFAFGGIQFLFSIYLQQVTQLPPLWSGIWMAPSAVGLLVGSLVAPTMVRWARPGIVVAGSLTIAVVGLGIVALVTTSEPTDTSSTGFLLTQLGVTLAFLGMGPSMVLGADLVVGSAPQEKAGSASAMEETAAEFGVAMGIAVIGSVGTAVYRARMSVVDTADVSSEAARHATESLDSAMAEARTIGPDLVARAQEAFTQGFVWTSAGSAVLLLVVAIGAAVFLRDTSTDGGHG